MDVKYQDYYAVLGVDKKATQDEIQKAYRKKARKYHPDVNQEPGAKEKFQKVGEAYEVLKDPEKRRKFDLLGSNWRAGDRFDPRGAGGFSPGDFNFDFSQGAQGGFGAGGPGGGFSDFFESLFGGAGAAGGGRRRSARANPFGGGPQPAAKAKKKVLDFTLTIDELVRGVRKTITLEVTESGADGMPRRRTRTYDVTIPAGTKEGSKIRLARPANAGGELLLKVKIAKHPDFSHDGFDLTTVVPITPWEAALGGKVRVPTPDGAVMMKLPEGSSSGRRLRMKNKGLPQKGGARGDLHAELKIVVPKALTDEERALFEQLATASTFAPRD